MEKQEIIKIVESMGFRMDYDQWEKIGGAPYMRFVLVDPELNDDDLIFIWQKNYNLNYCFYCLANILFCAGQRKKVLEFTNVFTSLKTFQP